MFCKSCSQPVAAQAAFCGSCGQPMHGPLPNRYKLAYMFSGSVALAIVITTIALLVLSVVWRNTDHTNSEFSNEAVADLTAGPLTTEVPVSPTPDNHPMGGLSTTPVPPSPTPLPTPYETSTPQPTAFLFQNVPTPELTAQPPEPPQIFGDTRLSDTNGTVIFEDSTALVRLSVWLQDIALQTSLDQILVQFISDGEEFLLVALDPTRQYLPLVKTASFSSLSTTPSGLPAHAPGVSPLNREGWQELVLTLDLVRIGDNISTVGDLAELLKPLPSLEKWSVGYSETCWTGEQMVAAASIGSGVSGVGLPISGAAVTTTAGRSDASLLLASTAAISAHAATDEATSYLQALPKTHRLRIYHFPVPLTIFGLEHLGSCFTEVAAIAGVWRGEVTFTRPDFTTTTDYMLEVSTDCTSGEFCINRQQLEEVPYDIDGNYQDNTDWPEAQCFGLSSGETNTWYWACMLLQEDGTLAFQSADPYSEGFGTLYRLVELPISSLAGIWRGTASGGGEWTDPWMRNLFFEIRPACHRVEIPCLINLQNGGIHLLNENEIPGGYCFTNEAEATERCIYSREDGMLFYTAQGPLWGESGVLRKEDN